MFDLPVAAKPKNNLRALVGSTKKRDGHDFYPTPEIATVKFLEREKFAGEIWEPACGDGAMSRVIERYGYKVKSTDLIYRGYGFGGVDFLKSNYRTENIVTNPPFKRANQFLHNALTLASKKVAFLCRIQFLESKIRQKFFTEFPFRRLYVFSERLPFGDNNAVYYAWFVWEHGYQGKPEIEWL